MCKNMYIHHSSFINVVPVCCVCAHTPAGTNFTFTFIHAQILITNKLNTCHVCAHAHMYSCTLQA